MIEWSFKLILIILCSLVIGFVLGSQPVQRCPHCGKPTKGLSVLLYKYQDLSVEELERLRDECLTGKIINKIKRG